MVTQARPIFDGGRLSIADSSYVRKLEFCNLIGAFTFQYAAILLDLSKVTRPFPRWEGSGNETTLRGVGQDHVCAIFADSAL